MESWRIRNTTRKQSQKAGRGGGGGSREDSDDIGVAVEAKNDDRECEQRPEIEFEQPDILERGLPLRGDIPSAHHYCNGRVNETYHRRHAHLQVKLI
jgi:hypothetical protein